LGAGRAAVMNYDGRACAFTRKTRDEERCASQRVVRGGVITPICLRDHGLTLALTIFGAGLAGYIAYKFITATALFCASAVIPLQDVPVASVSVTEILIRGTFPFFVSKRFPGSFVRKRGMSPLSSFRYGTDGGHAIPGLRAIDATPLLAAASDDGAGREAA